MNKKVWGLALVLLTVAMLAAPMVGTAEACGFRRCRKPKTVETFTVTPFEDPSTFSNAVEVPGESKLICNGKIRIGHGATRELDYSGPLGTGKLYMLTLISITHLTTPNVTSAGIGGGIYKYTLVIDDGPYGSGTLKGIAKLKWNLDLTGMPFEGLWEQWDTAKLMPVEGDLDIKWVSIKGYFIIEAPPFPPFFGWWWTTTTVVS